jgi:hypothetical protein
MLVLANLRGTMVYGCSGLWGVWWLLVVLMITNMCYNTFLSA